MANNLKNDQTLAFVAALQTILDKLTDEMNASEQELQPHHVNTKAKYDQVHELYLEGMNEDSLYGVYTAVVLIGSANQAMHA